MTRTIRIDLDDDVDPVEYAQIANLVWAVATSWDSVQGVHVDGDHDRCDEVYDREYCQEPSTWSGGKSKRTGR